MQIIAGDFGLSLDQQKVQLALWSIFASVRELAPVFNYVSIDCDPAMLLQPLLMSNDLRNLPDDSKAILQNK